MNSEKFIPICEYAGNIRDFIGGWFIGDFTPSLHRTRDFEVSLKTHPAGEHWPDHFHLVATEYNVVVSGRVRVGDQEFEDGDIFVVGPGYIMRPEFLEDTKIVCVKVPGEPNDKYVVHDRFVERK